MDVVYSAAPLYAMGMVWLTIFNLRDNHPLELIRHWPDTLHFQA